MPGSFAALQLGSAFGPPAPPQGENRPQISAVLSSITRYDFQNVDGGSAAKIAHFEC
jgi:hypothetical protein